jgi:hypothetical protein
MFYRLVLSVLLCFGCIAAHAQPKEQRVALVIGNSSYKSSPLKNPVNDARDMANSLRGYGFTVIERTNLTTRQVGQTLREFRSKLTPGSVAVVFYAGHGVQIKGENYLPTVDAEINGEEDVPMQSLSTKQVMDVLGEAKTRMNLVFLDACRDNPYARSFRSGSRGIAKENAPSGTLISFATRPGSVAGDGNGRNGLYTSVLLEQIKQSNQPIEQVLKRVVSGVKVASKGQQEPWMEGSIEGDFCFAQCVAANSNLPNKKLDADQEAWQYSKQSNTVVAYDAYLREYPAGQYSSAARVAKEVLALDGAKNLSSSTQTQSDTAPLVFRPLRKISLVAPDSIENGAVVPVGFRFDPPLQSGESVNVVQNGKIIATVFVSEGVLEEYYTRVRMLQSGSLGARCSTCQDVNKYLPVGPVAGTLFVGQGYVENVRLRLQGNVLRALVGADSPSNSKIVVESQTFKAVVNNTEWISKNPYFQFNAGKLVGGVCLTYSTTEATKKECTVSQ